MTTLEELDFSGSAAVGNVAFLAKHVALKKLNITGTSANPAVFVTELLGLCDYALRLQCIGHSLFIRGWIVFYRITVDFAKN